MFKKIKIITLLSLIIFQSSCGFQPIYKSNLKSDETNFENKLAAIEIKSERNRVGQKLKSNLEAILNPNNVNVPKEYILELKLDKDLSTTFINPTGSAGRNRLILGASYELKTKDDGEIIATGKASSKDDFNVETNRFANYITEEELEINLTQLIAQNIRDSLINDLFNKSDKAQK